MMPHFVFNVVKNAFVLKFSLFNNPYPAIMK
jgi:hypothetical protein